MALYFVFFGFLLILTPVIIAYLNNVGDDGDLVNMLVNMPLDKIALFQFLGKSGFMFLGIGGVMYYMGI